jgi:hypothetical protein
MQSTEIIMYEGKAVALISLPLEEVFKEKTKHHLLFLLNPSLWRGYRGTWEIREEKLFLIGLETCISGGKEQNVGILFPGKTEVFADWYSGFLELGLGNLDYTTGRWTWSKIFWVYNGIVTDCEKDLLLRKWYK